MTRNYQDQDELENAHDVSGRVMNAPEFPSTLAAWCQAAYDVSASKGWHVDPEDGKLSRVPLRVALLHTEVSELFEAFRKDPFAPCDKPGLKLSRAAEELADIVIRLFDFIVEFQIDAKEVFISKTFARARVQAEHNLYSSRDLGKEICGLHDTLAHFSKYASEACELLFLQCVQFAVHHQIDLELAVQTKHTYNAGREYRHGGKKF